MSGLRDGGHAWVSGVASVGGGARDVLSYFPCGFGHANSLTHLTQIKHVCPGHPSIASRSESREDVSTLETPIGRCCLSCADEKHMNHMKRLSPESPAPPCLVLSASNCSSLVEARALRMVDLLQLLQSRSILSPLSPQAGDVVQRFDLFHWPMPVFWFDGCACSTFDPIGQPISVNGIIV